MDIMSLRLISTKRSGKEDFYIFFIVQEKVVLGAIKVLSGRLIVPINPLKLSFDYRTLSPEP